MTTVYLSIGSNIEREKHLHAGITALKKQFGTLILSSVYESDAVGFDGQPFLNLVASFKTEHPPEQVDSLLDIIEKNNGRTREQKKFNPRTLDLDLILYGDYISQDPTLEIPRDEITQYAFVLEPLAEIAGELLHPVLKTSYDQLWQRFDTSNLVQKRIDFNWD